MDNCASEGAPPGANHGAQSRTEVTNCQLRINNASRREQPGAGHVIDPPALPLRGSRANSSVYS